MLHVILKSVAKPCWDYLYVESEQFTVAKTQMCGKLEFETAQNNLFYLSGKWNIGEETYCLGSWIVAFFMSADTI